MRVEKNTFVDQRYIAHQSGIVGTGDTAMEAMGKVLEEVFRDKNESENPDPVVHLTVFHKIDCGCNDPSCPVEGEEGEVGGHIENCPCNHCHHEMGKLN